MVEAQLEPGELLAHAGWIQELARRLVGDGPAADDLVQETWLAALRSRPVRGRSLRPWLSRVVHNFARQDHRRRGGRPKHERFEEGSASNPTPDELLSRGELQAQLVQEVLGLREPYRSTVLLRFYEGFGTDEIARTRGVNRATVRSRLHRAIEELRGRLDRRNGGRSSEWMQALLPLWSPSFLGALVNTTTAKLTVAAGAIALLAVASVSVRNAGSARDAPVAEGGVAAQGLPMPKSATAERSSGVAEVASTTLAAGRSQRSSIALPPPKPDVTPALAGRWSGSLIDAVTGEALPAFAFEVRSPSGRERLRTDETGSFQTVEEHPLGALDVRWIDHAGMRRTPSIDSDEHGVAGDEWETLHFDPALDFDATGRSQGNTAPPPSTYPVSAGPTFRLDLLGAGDLDVESLSAVILGPGMDFRHPMARLHVAPLRPRGPDGHSWVRFMPLELELMLLPKSGPWPLEVFGGQGYWHGVGEVHSLVGVQSDVVAIELSPRGRLVGTLTDEVGAPVARASVSLSPSEGSGSPLTVRSDAAGEFQLEWIPAGKYRIEVEPRRHEKLVREVVIRNRETVELGLVLSARPIQGDVRGRLTSRSGHYQNRVMVLLDGRGDGATDLNQEVSWRAEGEEHVANFAFEDLPGGSYVVSLLSFGDSFPWSPNQRTVEPPAGDLTFQVADDLPTVDVTYEVVSADTGAPIEPFELHYSSNGAGLMWMAGLSPSSVPHFLGYPLGTTLDWAISAPGYAAAFGDAASIEYGADGGAWVHLELQRGWSARFVVVTGEERCPVPGARIEIDGEEAAQTDEQGRATVFCAVQPRAVRAWSDAGAGSAQGFERFQFLHSIVLR